MYPRHGHHPHRRPQRTAWAAAIALGLNLTTASAQALSESTFAFDTAPNALLKPFGTSAWRASGDNPSQGGYLALLDPVNGLSGGFVFEKFDDGQIAQGFRIRADLRIGNPTGNEGRSGEGFSISFARNHDPVVVASDRGSVPTDSDTAGAPEIGTRTGVSVSFDTWSGNTLPDGDDIEGLIVRVDDRTILRSSLPARNGGCSDVNSLQTGPYNANADGSPDALCWRPFEIALTPAGLLSVSWKGKILLNSAPVELGPFHGRLVLMGRTGVANQNAHLDNLSVTLTPPTIPVVGQPIPRINGFDIALDESPGISVIPESLVVDVDGATVPVAVTRNGRTHLIDHTLTPPGRFGAGSTHNVMVQFRDAAGRTFRESREFQTPNYALFNAAQRAPDVEPSSPGFRIRPHQVESRVDSSLDTLEAQLAHRLGTNRVDLTKSELPSDPDGAVRWVDRPIDFKNAEGDPGDLSWDFSLASLGIPGVNLAGERIATDDGAALEITGFIEFTRSGAHQFRIASDESFRLQTGPDPRDQLGERLAGQSGHIDSPTDALVWVEEPGFYPIRLIWQNASGGAQLEWSLLHPDGTASAIGDTTDPRSPRVFRQRKSAVPWVRRVHPAPNATDVHAQPEITLEFENAGQIVPGSIVLTLDGATLEFTLATLPSGSILRALPATALTPGSIPNMTLEYRTSAGSQIHASWEFRVLTRTVSLPTYLAGDPASASQPGFVWRTWQIEPSSNQRDPSLRIPPSSPYAEGILSGRVDTNVADLRAVNEEGAFPVSNGFQLATDPSAVDTSTPGFGSPWFPIPGVPGTGSAPKENIVSEALTYLHFPTPGSYVLGVSADGGFTLGIRHARPRHPLQILSPSSIAGPMASVPSRRDDPSATGIFGALPTLPIEAELVVARGNSPTTVPEYACGTALSNPDAIRGRIALVRRGGCDFNEKARNVQDAGGLAVLLDNDRPDPPFVAGGEDVGIALPFLMVSQKDGIRLRSSKGVHARIAHDVFSNELLSGAPADGFRRQTLGLDVPRAGVYAFRLLWHAPGPMARIRWFTILSDGSERAINEAGETLTISAFQSAQTPDPPSLGLFRDEHRTIILFEGTLESSPTATGDFAPDRETSSDGVFTINPAGDRRFFRARR